MHPSRQRSKFRPISKELTDETSEVCFIKVNLCACVSDWFVHGIYSGGSRNPTKFRRGHCAINGRNLIVGR